MALLLIMLLLFHGCWSIFNGIMLYSYIICTFNFDFNIIRQETLPWSFWFWLEWPWTISSGNTHSNFWLSAKCTIKPTPTAIRIASRQSMNAVRKIHNRKYAMVSMYCFMSFSGIKKLSHFSVIVRVIAHFTWLVEKCFKWNTTQEFCGSYKTIQIPVVVFTWIPLALPPPCLLSIASSNSYFAGITLYSANQRQTLLN